MHGAEVHSVNTAGDTPLFLAARLQRWDIVRDLVAFGAPLTLPTQGGAILSVCRYEAADGSAALARAIEVGTLQRLCRTVDCPMHGLPSFVGPPAAPNPPSAFERPIPQFPQLLSLPSQHRTISHATVAGADPTAAELSATWTAGSVLRQQRVSPPLTVHSPARFSAPSVGRPTDAVLAGPIHPVRLQ
uniref:Ankyrin repeat domain-containing protein 1 n=1 Tax=Lygus hesperus TaxID=30085 RepID=A0A0A9W5P7_LYGHE